ncbi:MAG: Re/Si-specific NAD(P)(+) transhydrogenase subunit alpha [Candidatus Rokuibacteriota bacterium]|nr:MAG: Re/Si-specific NAD(P)(+) transhydrogenase subunit alpha [Candidatus Rokubacteria bacterium]
MKIGVPKEVKRGERRVAIIPETVKRLAAKGITVAVEGGAGAAAWFSDEEYRSAGATVEPSADPVLGVADLVVKIHPPTQAEVERVRPGTAVISLLYPQVNADLVRLLAAKSVAAIAVDQIPRTTLAQTMDVLSSQSTVAGYRAVILAAQALPKFFPMLMTAAGTVAPARVLVLGAGVAGLQAIAVARRLGAIVEAFDVRREVKEQIESLGARFVETGATEDAAGAGGYARELSEETERRNRDVIAEHLAKTDVCITTALIPGKRAPILITEEMVRRMRAGSVLVDLAAEQGGNCVLTEPGTTVTRHDVTILGPLDLPSDLAVHASQMYSRNMEKLLLHLTRDGVLVLDFEDEITRGCVVTHGGQIVQPRPKERPAAGGGT